MHEIPHTPTLQGIVVTFLLKQIDSVVDVVDCGALMDPGPSLQTGKCTTMYIDEQTFLASTFESC